MEIKVTKSELHGEIMIPGSKSHTIRAVALAGMAEGVSVLRNALLSSDTISCLEAIEKLGAQVKQDEELSIHGIGGEMTCSCKIDVGNSGTTLRILTALAALSSQPVHFDGDKSIRKRPMQPLLTALENLGARVNSTEGKCPFTIRGPIEGGFTRVDGISSQFLTAILLATPLVKHDTEIIVDNLHEKPYIEITLDWLDRMNIQYKRLGEDHFIVMGNQSYKAFEATIPADFSSATFPLCAAAITGSDILIRGLNFKDHQGDKLVFSHLEKMGVSLNHTEQGLFVKGGKLRGIDIDLNATPDALPALAVVGCFAEGTTRLLNVKQARLKECDRISAMHRELTKMGAKVEELEDGMVIHQSKLNGGWVHGYDDHRIVMALACAGLATENRTVIDTAESIKVTYPTFIEDFQQIDANIEKNN